jgi:hypothetical protein
MNSLGLNIAPRISFGWIWRGMDFTLLLNSTLKFLSLCCGLQTADCQSQESKFESGLPKTQTLRNVRIRPQSGS